LEPQQGPPDQWQQRRERQHGVRNLGSVGRDEPDLSKEKNTEIAVEAGRKGPEHRDDKR
jgi:hypothetical protein